MSGAPGWVSLSDTAGALAASAFFASLFPSSWLTLGFLWTGPLLQYPRGRASNSEPRFAARNLKQRAALRGPQSETASRVARPAI